MSSREGNVTVLIFKRDNDITFAHARDRGENNTRFYSSRFFFLSFQRLVLLRMSALQNRGSLAGNLFSCNLLLQSKLIASKSKFFQLMRNSHVNTQQYVLLLISRAWFFFVRSLC